MFSSVTMQPVRSVVKSSDSRIATAGAIGTLRNIINTLLVIVFLLLAFAIGAQGINIDNVWFDEIVSIEEMGAFQSSYNPLMTIEMMRQSSPDAVPLWYWITRAWIEVAGWSHFSLRLVSTFAGTMMIAMMFRLGADFFGKPVGVVAAGFMASSGFMLWYFHEARPNALMMCSPPCTPGFTCELLCSKNAACGLGFCLPPQVSR